MGTNNEHLSVRWFCHCASNVGSVLYFFALMKIRDWIYALCCCPDGNNREKVHSALLFLKVPIFFWKSFSSVFCQCVNDKVINTQNGQSEQISQWKLQLFKGNKFVCSLQTLACYPCFRMLNCRLFYSLLLDVGLESFLCIPLFRCWVGFFGLDVALEWIHNMNHMSFIIHWEYSIHSVVLLFILCCPCKILCEMRTETKYITQQIYLYFKIYII